MLPLKDAGYAGTQTVNANEGCVFRFLNGLQLMMCCVLISAILHTHSSFAAPIGIIGYDIDNALTDQPVNPAALGFFGHTNSYSGTITDTGLTASTPFGSGTLVNYSGGTGTLTDGNISSGSQNTQFFTISSDPGGGPVSVGLTITLFLDGFYKLSSLEFFGTNNSQSSLPGRLDGVDVEVFDGTTASFSPTTPFGPNNSQGVPVHDRVNFLGSSVDGLETDRIILSNFTSTGNDIFIVSEIMGDGEFIKGLPAPGQLAVFCAALAFYGLRRFRATAR
jgi:hypothetical protein